MRKVEIKQTFLYMLVALFLSSIITIFHLYYKLSFLALLSGFPVVLIGAGIAWINQIIMVGIGFEKSMKCGLACLFIPFTVVFLFNEKQWEKAYEPLVKSFMGFAFLLLGVLIIIINQKYG